MITRNEKDAISKVMKRVVGKAVPDAEILVVDSNYDCTAEVAEELGAKVMTISARHLNRHGPGMRIPPAAKL